MVSPRLLSISVCLLAAASGAAAQEPLTMSEATAQALAKNHAIRIERESIAAADARMIGARGEYDPLLRFDVIGRRWRDPNTSLFSGAPNGDEASTSSSIGSSLSITQLFKTGATASLWTSVSPTAPQRSDLFQPALSDLLGVDLRQPLLRIAPSIHQSSPPCDGARPRSVGRRSRSADARDGIGGRGGVLNARRGAT